ncbi:MAG: tetratricopeptide repeat protein [Planctomycetaceae bacterium]
MMMFSLAVGDRAARIQILALSVVLGMASGLAGWCLAQEADPYTKTFADFEWNEDEERVPIPGSIDVGKTVPTPAAIKSFERRLAETPDDFLALSILGQLYFRHAKEADDLPFYARAADALERAVNLQPQYDAAKLHLAEVYASQHRFKEALQLASGVNARDPDSPRAWAIVSDCQLELGRYEDGKESLDALVKREQSPPIQARLARYAELTGDTDRAIELIDTAIAGLETQGASAEETMWYHWRKATLLLGRGEIEQAKQLYQRVLEIDANDSAALFGLAEAQAASGDRAAAIPTVQKIIDLYGAPPAMALMGDLLAESGQTEAAEQWYQQTESAMREEMLIAGDAHAREVAMFFADHRRHPAEAVALAAKDLERRQDIYSYDTLAWCQYQAGDTAQAAESMKKSLRLGTQDAKLYLHAAEIFKANGQVEESQAMLAKARRINPRLTPLSSSP